MAATDLTIKQGKTFGQVLRWEADKRIVYKAITAITKAAPVRITAAGHGLVDGWRAAIVAVKGMIQINAKHSPLRDSDYHIVTVIDSSTIEINSLNTAATDDNGTDEYSAYTSGGYLQYNAPASLNGYTARMTIKDKIGGTVLASTEVAHAPLNTITATLDDAAKTITITISAAATAAITWTRGVYDIEAVDSGGTVVTELRKGIITVSKEITT